jgi:serine/threonine-protein kinase
MNHMAQGDSNSADATALGRIVVEQQLAAAEQVEPCLALFRQLPAGEATSERLRDLLVSNGVLTAGQWQRVTTLADQRRSPGQIPGYKLIEKVGSGAMGMVFKARQVSLDRTVAIKVLPRKHTEDPTFVDRFYAEGRAAARLNHPNIVQAIDVGQAGEWHFFVMEFIEGHTVYDHFQQHGKYDEAQAVRIVIQIAEALRHAHEKGFMHRDVKPKNIMITREGVAKLADMGLAREVTDKEAAEAEAGKAYGTPYYISPEQVRGSVNVDQRADIYGLGATFYHMVTGRVPFDGANASAVMAKHVKQALTPPDHVNPKLSAGVSEIIEMMMAKERDKRYRTAAELLDDLRSVEAGNPPMHARRQFSVANLAALEETAKIDTPRELASSTGSQSGSILQQPLFWIAVASGILNIILIILLAN